VSLSVNLVWTAAQQGRYQLWTYVHLRTYIFCCESDQINIAPYGQTSHSAPSYCIFGSWVQSFCDPKKIYELKAPESLYERCSFLRVCVHLYRSINVRSNNSHTLYICPEYWNCENFLQCGTIFFKKTQKLSCQPNIIAVNTFFCMQDFSIILSTIRNPWHYVTGTLESRSIKELTKNFNHTNSHTVFNHHHCLNILNNQYFQLI